MFTLFTILNLKTGQTFSFKFVYNLTSDKRGWYERLENNGWRLVSDRLIHHAMTDSTTYDSAQKKIDFHHNKAST